MEKKLSIRESMKPVVDALRDGKKSWSDLKQLKVQKRDIPEKTLDRILDYLQYWQLVKKEGVYWVWYEHSRIFNSTDEFNLYLDHSRKLIPALKSIIGITPEEEHPLESYADEHLRSYPEVYQKLTKFRDLQQKQVGKLFGMIKGRIKTPDKMWTMHFEKRKTESFIGRIFGESVLVKEDVPYYLGPFTLKELGEIQKLLGHPTRIYESGKGDKKEYMIHGPIRVAMLDEMFELYREIAGDISLLILKVDNGEPLEGICSLCPKVKIH